MSPMKKARCYFGSMLDFLHKKIYVFGGSNSTKCHDDIEFYDLEKDEWKLLGLKLPHPLYAFSFRQIEIERTLVIGGADPES